MRIFWAIFLGGLVLVGAAEARLGDSKEQVIQRYGKPEAEMPAEAVWTDAFLYGGEDYVRTFFFLHGKVVQIIIMKHEDDPYFKNEEVKKLFEELTDSSGYKPKFIQGDTKLEKDVVYVDPSGVRAMWGRVDLSSFGPKMTGYGDVVFFFTEEGYRLFERECAKDKGL